MKKLVTYFSVSGTTEKLAEDLAKAIEGDIYKIEPKIPYTDADLNWRDKNSRSSVEMADENSRPEIVENNPKIADYDVIFVGFPIWWYTAPSIIHTFLETYDFSNKKIVVFATSGSSDLGNTINDIKKSLPETAEVVGGSVLNHNPSVENLKNWVDGLNL
ncbi:MAG: NAD(P)H-dependent oxidoreductase [Rickettsiales bacterium]|nr:NAD(P)H-dependent oxidoreductase [Rickettsiales bacterium]